jgi:hypothetical protein
MSGHAFAEIIKHHDTSHTTQPTKRFLVQLGPDSRAGAEHQQPHRFSTVPQRQNEQPRVPILAALRIAHHGARAVIDLRFFAGRRLDHHPSFRRRRSAELVYEPLDAGVSSGEPVAVHQVLPDRHGVAPFGKRAFDDLPIGFASTRRRTSPRPRVHRHGLVSSFRVGGHLYGRFYRIPAPWRAHRDSHTPEICPGGFAANVRGSLNARQRPPQPSQRRDGRSPSHHSQCPGSAISLAGFRVFTYSRFWVSPQENASVDTEGGSFHISPTRFRSSAHYPVVVAGPHLCFHLSVARR